MLDTLLLRALAALLIANSHIEAYYPVPQLAADGLLGDALFFFLSGYGLVRSDRNQARGFRDWYARRWARIYPSVLLALLGEYLLHAGWRDWAWTDYVLNFGLGLRYVFVTQILAYYVVFYALMRRGGTRWLGRLVGLLLVPLGLLGLLGTRFETTHAVHLLFYFQAMLLGGWLGGRDGAVEPAGAWRLAALAALLTLYAGARAAVATGRLEGGFGVVPHLLLLPMLGLLLGVARSRPIADGLLSRPWASWLIGLVGGSSLELYLVHYQLMVVPEIAALAFPANVLVFVVLSIALARLLAVTAAGLRGLARGALSHRWLLA
jgi:peptidoglycan/LPS O-acetylase OafA/YrhL